MVESMDITGHRPEYSWLPPAGDNHDNTTSRKHRSTSPIAKVDHSSEGMENDVENVSEQVVIFQQTSKKIIVTAIMQPVAGTLAVGATVLALIATIMSPKTIRHAPGSCQTDGTFRFMQPYNPWAMSGLFRISLSFGNLTFSNAKLMDVMWDLVVGRGGQCILGCIAYAVFTKSLVRIMEQKPISYGTYEAVTFRNSTAFSIWLMIRDFATNSGRRAKVAILWMMVASLYVLAFPTLISAMTGYATNSEALIKDVKGSLLPWSSLVPVIYVIHDGWRVGLSGNQLITTIRHLPGQPLQDPDQSYIYDGCEDYDPSPFSPFRPRSPFRDPDSDSDPTSIMNWNMPEECLLLWHTANYVRRYSLGGRTNSTSTFNKSGHLIDLPAPTLNVTSFWRYSTRYPKRSNDKSTLRFATGMNTNDSYDAAYVDANGSCQTTNTYRWGFSFLLLCMVVLLTALWALGTHIMWLDAHFVSQYDRACHSIGTHRAALDFATALVKDMGEDSPPDCVSEKELILRRKKALNGGKIPPLDPVSAKYDGFRIYPRTAAEEVWEYLKGRRWGRMMGEYCVRLLIIVLALGTVTGICLRPVIPTRLGEGFFDAGEKPYPSLYDASVPQSYHP